MHKKYRRGFSLAEILIYTGIVAVVGTLFGGVLLNVTKVQNRQSSSGEVNTQLQFVLQNINRYIKNSSNIDIDNNVSTSTLVLRMQDQTKDPTLIYTQNQKVYIQEGTDSPTPLTTDAVLADTLTFYKISSSAGHDSVQVDAIFSFNTSNPSQSFSQALSSAVVRVSAATFDSSLIPGATDNYDIGLSSSRWKNMFLSGDLTIGGKTILGNLSADPAGSNGMIYYNTADNVYRAYQNGTWTNIGGGGGWALSGSLLYNTNGSNVGIGTKIPTYGLTVATTTIAFNADNNGTLDTWATNVNALPAPRSSQSTIVANGVLYVIGGSNGPNSQSTVYYAKIQPNGSTGGWTTNANPLPAPRDGHASIVFNNFAYVIGGQDNGTLRATVFYSRINTDGSLGTWTTATNALPTVLANHASVVANGYVYTLGGNNGGTIGNVYYAKLNADGSVGTWQTGTSLLAVRRTHDALFANGYIYVVGGWDAGQKATVYYAKANSDGSIGSWSSANDLPGNRNYLSTGTLNGYLYVVGGNHGTAGNSTVFYAKINTDGSLGTWQTNINALPGTSYGQSSVVFNGYLYSVGGFDSNGATPSSVIYYSSGARTSFATTLDLLGLNRANTSESGGQGSALYAGNIYSNNNLEVKGNGQFFNGLGVNGNVSVNGTLYANSVQFSDGSTQASAGSQTIKTRLIVQTNASFPGTKVDISAYKLGVGGSVFTNVAVTADIGVVGANGRDTAGAPSNDTWYSVWAITDGSTIASLLSTADGVSSQPTLPSGYTYARRVGWVRRYSDSAFRKFLQSGQTYEYTDNIFDRYVYYNTNVPNSDTWITIDTSPQVPPGVRFAWMGYGYAVIGGDPTGGISIRPVGSDYPASLGGDYTHALGGAAARNITGASPNEYSSSGQFNVGLNTSRQFEIRVGIGSNPSGNSQTNRIRFSVFGFRDEDL